MNLQTLRDDLKVLLLVAVVALGVGWMGNSFRASPLPLNQSHPTAPALNLEQFKAHQESHSLILDARPALFYQFAHVPGAYNLPRNDFEKNFEILKVRLEADKHQPIAIYCSDLDCPDSEVVQKKLVSMGFTRVFLFKDGFAAWEKAGLPVEKE